MRVAKMSAWVLGGVVGGLAAGLAGGCETNPTTGRSQLSLLSRDQEIALGAQAQPELVAEFGGKVNDAALQQYVADIGHRLAAVTEADNPSLPWEFTLLDSDAINAFALPGGKVFISRGLAAQMTNEAQLAGVLGHEVGHVTARHTSERMSQSLGASGIAAIGGALIGAATDDERIAAAAPVALSVGGQLVVLRFSRSQETESDTLGMRYMTKLGYDPRGQLEVMQILQRAAGDAGGLELFATHPHPETRIQNIERLLATEYRATQNNPQYQKHADRFRQRFLSRLASLPPAPHGRGAGMMAAAGWCAHCAAAEAEGKVLGGDGALARGER